MKYFIAFRYLVAFTFVDGNIEIDYLKPIQGMSDIKELQLRIALELKVQNPVIINFQRFEDDYKLKIN